MAHWARCAADPCLQEPHQRRRLAIAPHHVEPLYAPAKFAEPPARDIGRLRRELDVAETDARSRLAALEASNAVLEAIQTQIEALRTEIASLEAKRAALGPSRPTIPEAAETDQLSAAWTNVAKRSQLLQADLARAKAPVPQQLAARTRNFRNHQHPATRLPVPVELIHNQIAPVTRDFFNFSTFKRANYSATRSRRGETIDEASKPASLFGKFLTKLHPNREYILLLVNPDSFDAFYAIRELAMKAGVEISWQPSDTSDGKIAIVHVVLPSKGHPGTIPLPYLVQ